MRKNKIILGIRLNSTSINSVLKFVSLNLKNRHKFFLVTPNPEIIVAAQKNKALFEALNSALIAIPDGVGLKLAQRNLKIIKGRELMLSLFDLANKEKLKIFLLGSDKKTIDKSLQIVSKFYSNAIARGVSGPKLNQTAQPVNPEHARLEKQAIRLINNFKPDLLFVAFGAPKQELWVKKHLSELRVGGVMVLGGALDYFAGTAKLPPGFITKIGLEWFWRLVWQPTRLPRIFRAVVIFPARVLMERLGRLSA